MNYSLNQEAGHTLQKAMRVRPSQCVLSHGAPHTMMVCFAALRLNVFLGRLVGTIFKTVQPRCLAGRAHHEKNTYVGHAVGVRDHATLLCIPSTATSM
jgi:hypothetical protein